MRKLTSFIFGISIMLATTGTAMAHPNDGLEGLVIGGAGGAAVGHIVTGTPEGMIIGSLLGGTIGMLIDAGDDHHGVVFVRDRQHHPGHWTGKYYRDSKHRWYKGDKYYYGKHRHGPRWDRHRGRHLR